MSVPAKNLTQINTLVQVLKIANENEGILQVIRKINNNIRLIILKLDTEYQALIKQAEPFKDKFNMKNLIIAHLQSTSLVEKFLPNYETDTMEIHIQHHTQNQTIMLQADSILSYLTNAKPISEDKVADLRNAVYASQKTLNEQ